MPRLTAALLVTALVSAGGLFPFAPAAAQEAVTVSITPANEGDTAVRNSRQIVVSGTAPAGPVTAARLVGLEGGGGQVSQNVTSHVTNSDGRLDGRPTLGCLFGDPDRPCPFPHGAVREVYLEVTVGGVTGRSNPLPIDYVDPRIDQFRLVKTDTIDVIWSEAVRLPNRTEGAGGDNPLDWKIDRDHNTETPDTRVVSVTAPAPHIRRLEFTPPVGEDATPLSQYEPALTRPLYIDRASNQADRSTAAGGIADAVDAIRPAVPRIESISGRSTSGGQTSGTDPKPRVRVSNVTPGHVVVVTASGGPGTLEQRTTVADGASTVEVFFSDPLPSDGRYQILAVAIDPALNRSDEREKNPPREDGAPNPVGYILDTVAPRGLAAAQTGTRSVRVAFTEPVQPANHAGKWTVGEQTATAQGDGAERRLTTPADIAPGAVVRWEPTSTTPLAAGTYEDAAGNQLQTITGLEVASLPPLPLPTVTTPAQEIATRSNSTTIAGSAPGDAEGAAVDLLHRRTGEVVNSTTVRDGRWSMEQPLPADARYQFDVQLRSGLGSRSPRVAVPDIIRDISRPEVDVREPASEPVTHLPDRRPRRAPGGTVAVRWQSRDPAAGDPVDPDHARLATISAVFPGDGNERVLGTRTQTNEDAGREQTFTYTLTESDLAGLGQREVRFKVAVADVADNVGQDLSDPILIVGNLIDWTPVLVSAGVVEAQFPVRLEGNTMAADWRVDGVPPQTAEKLERDGRTVVRLTASQVRDPNATPPVTYQPVPVNPTPLRGTDQREIISGTRVAVDAIVPLLHIDAAPEPGVYDADSVTFSGTTDRTDHPNTVVAYRTNANGALQGAPVASTSAGTDGRWRMEVPLAQNATNHLVVRASDPSGNVSHALPNPPLTVVEDSLAPVVAITSPKSATLVAPVLDITWTTTEANKSTVRIDYRVGSEPWQVIADGISDTGSYRWEIPETVQREIFSIRVTATDQVGKTGAATVHGLRLDLQAPTIVKARASGAQVVDVTFSEPVALDGSGFTIGGATVRRIKGDGVTRTFILNDPIDSTTPQVEYSGTSVYDVAGNKLQATTVRASRSFAFGVTGLRGQRVTTNRVRVTWTDTRNRPADLRGYRVYRDGSPIALVGSSTRAFTDAKGKGRNIYSVRAVDDRRRVSSVRRVVVR